MIKAILCLFLTILLVSCDSNYTYEEGWILKGKVLLQKDKDKQSGYFYWQESEDNFIFIINSFLGTKVFEINYEDGISTVLLEGKVYKGKSPEELLKRTIGKSFPIRKIKDLIFNQKDNFIYNNELWKINYKNNEIINNEITLKSKKQKIKLKITEFEKV